MALVLRLALVSARCLEEQEVGEWTEGGAYWEGPCGSSSPLETCAQRSCSGTSTQRDLVVAVVGDSRARELYATMARQVDASFVEYRNESTKHADRSVATRQGFELHFSWLAHVEQLNTSALFDDLEARLCDEGALVLLSTSLWRIKQTNASDEAKSIREFLEAVSRSQVIERLERLARRHPNVAVVWMLPGPVVEEQLWDARKNLRNALIEQFNRAIEQRLRQLGPSIQLFSFGKVIDTATPPTTTDGLHYNTIIKQALASQLLSASVCRHYDDSSSRVSLTSSQPLLIAIPLLSALTVLLLYRHIRNGNKK